MTSKQKFNYDEYLREYRKACAKHGIDPVEGATGYQVVHVVAEQRRAAQQQSRWWQHHEMWLTCPPYRSETEEDAVWGVFKAAYGETMRRFARLCLRRMERGSASQEKMPLRELHQLSNGWSENSVTKRRNYSSWTKAAALAEVDRNGGKVYQTAKAIGVSARTLERWVRAARLQGDPAAAGSLPPEDEAALDDQLEQLARQMVAVMPEKVEQANLQELTRSLAIVLGAINQTRTGKETTSHAREKLAEILERYAAAASTEGTPEPPDGL